MNMIPKEGSNRLLAEGIAYGSRQEFESNNLGDLQNPPYNFRYVPQLFFFDFNPVVGGPIKENRLWYFGSVQRIDVKTKFWPVKKRFKVADFNQLENSGLYWHIVDIIWIFLFPLFYLIT